jgi:hypothetical protein
MFLSRQRLYMLFIIYIPKETAEMRLYSIWKGTAGLYLKAHLDEICGSDFFNVSNPNVFKGI